MLDKDEDATLNIRPMIANILKWGTYHRTIEISPTYLQQKM